MKENVVKDKSFKFALDIIGLYKRLIEEKEYIISKQLLRSGTSIGANITEGIHGQSKKDFLSKIYIAYKEANETRYWLELLEKSNITEININSYLKDIEELIKILGSITKTTSENL